MISLHFKHMDIVIATTAWILGKIPPRRKDSGAITCQSLIWLLKFHTSSSSTTWLYTIHCATPNPDAAPKTQSFPA
jgi:hypothetical protein